MRESDFIPFGVADKFNPREEGKYLQSDWYFQKHNIMVNGQNTQFIPWFSGLNNEPAYLMHLLSNNPIILGMVITKCDILRGKKLTLFNNQELDQNGNPTPLPETDWPAEIQDFYEFNDLNCWAYDSFLQHEILGNAFQEVIASKQSSQRAAQVAEINLISGEMVRAVAKKNKRGKVELYGVNHSWAEGIIQKDVERMPAYHRKDFYRKGQFAAEGIPAKMMIHLRRALPSMPVYAIPRYYGARHWIEGQNLVPIFHKKNLENMFGIRMRVGVNNAVIRRIIEKAQAEDVTLTDQQVLTQLANDFTKYFTSPEKAGAATTSAFTYDSQGRPVHDYLFEPIQADLKDDAFTKLDGPMNQASTSSMGISPSLAGIILNNSLGSGSEQRYAWNIEVVKGQYTRDLILSPLRFIHKYNGWDQNLSWGFLSDAMVTADVDKSGTLSLNLNRNNDDAV